MRFESPRSHAEFQDVEENLKALDIGDCFDEQDDTPPQKVRSCLVPGTGRRSRSTQTRHLRAEKADTTEPGADLPCPPRLSQSATRQSFSNDKRHVTVPRRHSKMRALLEKLNRSTDPENLEVKDDSQLAITEWERMHSSINQVQSRTSLRRAKSASESCSTKRILADRAMLGKQEVRKSRKRIPIRAFRMQQKAAIAIQCICRRFLARSKFQRKLLKEQYLGYIKGKRSEKVRLEKEGLDYSEKLINLQRQTQNDISAMRMNIELEKTQLAARARDALAANQQVGCSDDETQVDEIYTQIAQEVQSLQKEQKMLIAEAMLLEEITSDLEQENDKMMNANQQIMTMFFALNDYAKANVAQKQSLEEEAKIYNKAEVNKVRQLIRVCSTASMVETSAKNLYRGYIYKHIYTNTRTTNNAELFESVIETMLECESCLGNEVLSPDDAKILLEITESEYSENSDDEDDLYY